MLTAIKRFFEDRLDRDPVDVPEQTDPLALATAALMIEVMRADEQSDAAASARVLAALEETFDLPHAEIEELIRLAEEELETATDLYQFTRLVTEHWGQEERIALIRNMWRVAWADGSVHRYEEHLIRRIADLIYVRHRDFITAKLETRPVS